MKLPAIQFTDRQKQVVSLMIMGQSRKAIADRLKISVATVDDHLEKIRHKLGAYTTNQAIVHLLNLGNRAGKYSASLSGLLKK